MDTNQHITNSRSTRSAMTEAHDDGRHVHSSQSVELRRDAVDYWRTCCADCAAIWRYEYK